MAEDWEREGRFRDEDVAGDDFEGAACGVCAALVVAGADHGEALPLHLDLRRADDVTCGHQADIDIADAVGFAIRRGLAGLGESFAIACRHGFERFWRGENGAVAGAGVIGMAVRDDGAINPTAHGVDVEITRRAIEALWRRAEKVFGADHVWRYEGRQRFSQIVLSVVLQFALPRVSEA